MQDRNAMSFFSSTSARVQERRPTPAPARPETPSSDAANFYREVIERRPALLDEKLKVHARIIDEFNLSLLEKLPHEELVRQVRAYVTNYVRAEKISLNQRELDVFSDEIINEMTGFGPIEPLLKDPTVTDILINTHEVCFVERFGRLYETKVHFKDEAHLLRIVNKIVAGIGRRVDESSPMVDARLPDGSRVNVAIRPVAIDGPLVSIRKFSERPFSMLRLIEGDTLCQKMADVLTVAVQGRVSLIISGGTGSGKTTMLNALSSFIPAHERLITIEDAAELQLQQPHVGRLETRPPNAEGKGEIRQRELVKNALRMRPNRIIIGECRGEEAFDMLQAMNTGHEGSMSTIHANNPREALTRLENMIGMAGINLPSRAMRTQIASAVHLICQVQRMRDGGRRVSHITEVVGMEGEIITTQDLFTFQFQGEGPDGKLKGAFLPSGIRPAFLPRAEMFGLDKALLEVI